MQRLSFAIVPDGRRRSHGAGDRERAGPNVALKLDGSVVTHDAKGAVVLTPLARADLRSGETIRYDIVATNSGDDVARHLVPLGKIPAGTAYEPSTATSSAVLHPEFSLDGGKTWATRPIVTHVHTASGDVTQPADPALYTTLRWVGAAALAAKSSVTYSYQVRIK